MRCKVEGECRVSYLSACPFDSILSVSLEGVIASCLSCRNSATSTDLARKCICSSPTTMHHYYGGPGALSRSGLESRLGEAAKRSVSARSGQALCKGSMDSQLASSDRLSLSLDFRDTGTSPVLFDLTSAAVLDRTNTTASRSYSMPQQQHSQSVPRKIHRTNESAHYIDMQHKVQQCQDVLRKQSIHQQVRFSYEVSLLRDVLPV